MRHLLAFITYLVKIKSFLYDQYQKKYWAGYIGR